MSTEQINKPKKSFKSQSVNNLFRQQTSTIQKNQLNVKSPSPVSNKSSYKIKTISSLNSKLKIIPSKKATDNIEAKKNGINNSILNPSDSTQTVWKLPKSRSNSPDVGIQIKKRPTEQVPTTLSINTDIKISNPSPDLNITPNNGSSSLNTPRTTSKFNDTFNKIQSQNSSGRSAPRANSGKKTILQHKPKFSWADDDENDKFWSELQNSIDENIVNEGPQKNDLISDNTVTPNAGHSINSIQDPTTVPMSSTVTTTILNINPKRSSSMQSPFFSDLNDTLTTPTTISNTSNPPSIPHSNTSNQSGNNLTVQTNNNTWQKSTPVLDFRRNTSPLLQFSSNHSNSNNSFNHRNSLQTLSSWSTPVPPNSGTSISDFLNSNLNQFIIDDNFKYNDNNSNLNSNASMMKPTSTSNIDSTNFKGNSTYPQSSIPLTPPRANGSFGWLNSHQNMNSNNINSKPNLAERSNSNKTSIWNNDTTNQTQENLLWSPFLNSESSQFTNNNPTSRFFPTSLIEDELLINDVTKNLKLDSFNNSSNALKANNILSAFEISTPAPEVKPKPKIILKSRVDRTKDKAPVSNITTKSIKILKEEHPAVLLVSTTPDYVSFNSQFNKELSIESLISSISFPNLKDKTKKPNKEIPNDINLKKMTTSYPEGFSSTFYKRGINNFMFVRELQPKLTNKFKNDRQYIEIRINFPHLDDSNNSEEDNDDSNTNYYETGEEYSEEDDEYYENEGNDESFVVKNGKRNCFIVNIDVRELEGKLNGLRISKNNSSSKKFGGSHYNNSNHGGSNSYYYNSKYNSYNSKYTRK